MTDDTLTKRDQLRRDAALTVVALSDQAAITLGRVERVLWDYDQRVQALQDGANDD